MIVATRAAVAGMPELVSGENCLVLDAVRGFPRALEDLLRNPDLRLKYSTRGRATFEAQFRKESNLEKYRELLRSILSRPAAS